MKSCPPCSKDCQQGRSCPHRHSRMRHRPIILGLMLALPFWALLAWLIFSGATS